MTTECLQVRSEQFIDGFQQVHFLGGMVRIDTFRLTPHEGEEPRQEPAGQIIMTPQGFVTALNAMQQLADKLVESGILQKTQQHVE